MVGHAFLIGYVQVNKLSPELALDSILKKSNQMINTCIIGVSAKKLDL